MADRTGIEWTDASWNPVVGCSLVSPGCTNCYAMGQAARIVRCSEGLRRPSTYDGTVETVKGKPVWTGKVALASDATLTQPLRWKRPRRIFVNSMGDLFHEDVPDAWIDRVFAVMALAPQHTFQILTKRSARMRAYVLAAEKRLGRSPNVRVASPMQYFSARRIGDHKVWPLPNVWLGVSAEDQRRADERIPDLLATPAAIRFVSAEPLLGAINFRHFRSDETYSPDSDPHNDLDALTGIVGNLAVAHTERRPKLDWIIVGGESGPNARPMHPDWARAIRNQCAAAGTAFFFKQWGEWKHGSDFAADAKAVLSDGTVSDPTPDALQQLDRVESVPRRHPTMMRKVGKARAGRILDGVTHDAMPEVRHG